MKFTPIFTALMFCIGAGHSQSILHGIVENQIDRSPIPYAMIFLTNTSVGTTSDSLGRFSLEISDGKHELVVKSMGFHTITFALDGTKIQPGLYRFQMGEEEVSMDEILVDAQRDPSWYHNLEIFKYHFIGSSTHASKTKILNEKDLIIDDVTKRNSLLVNSKKTLQIENASLGYLIEYTLQEFEYTKQDQRILYAGYIFFKPLEGLSNRKTKQITRNRDKAYEGSAMHLIRAIYKNTVVEEGFQLRRIKRLPNPDRPTEEELNLLSEKLRKGEPIPYSMEEFSRLRRLPKFIDYMSDEVLDLSKYITIGEDGQKILVFEDLIQVMYKKAKPDVNYKPKYPTDFQESIIHLTKGTVELYENGSHYPPFDLLFEGYLGWQKTGDLLPLDFNFIP
ncbi:carboxypeptidase-like regulatory domain-containing protein [Belliella sp. DSM 111904]|uniref:Carboxypeptidase-like regulatory domain-containing protein n=1 Tax=Belliella filtrata TaxID=2923435 RepID=A0ABS9V1X3_9BACT|nr:carboxypeptidase-like regulatory domain-containing protein [Belliella filtrata]MCH7410417.1 carboxypeptidase-like regulatory domain-containing protein [Belliella filtrata]